MGNIQASLVLEILGRPKENVSTALSGLVDKLSAEKGVKIVNKTLHEPMPVEKSDLFTSFAELDVEADSVMSYLGIIFGYMPSNIEITYPEKITFGNSELNELANTLVRRLHHYDALTKSVVSERNFFAEKLKQTAPHLFKKPDAPSKKTSEKKKS